MQRSDETGLKLHPLGDFDIADIIDDLFAKIAQSDFTTFKYHQFYLFNIIVCTSQVGGGVTLNLHRTTDDKIYHSTGFFQMSTLRRDVFTKNLIFNYDNKRFEYVESVKGHELTRFAEYEITNLVSNYICDCCLSIIKIFNSKILLVFYFANVRYTIKINFEIGVADVLFNDTKCSEYDNTTPIYHMLLRLANIAYKTNVLEEFNKIKTTEEFMDFVREITALEMFSNIQVVRRVKAATKTLEF